MTLVNMGPNQELATIVLVAKCAPSAATPLFGHLSQIFGRKRVFLGLGIANLILIPCCYTQLSHLTPDALGLIYLYAGVLTFCGNAPLGPMIIFLNERFPTSTRATGVAVSWSIGFAVGGMMPTFVTLASRSVANITSTLLAFLLAAIVIYIAGALIVPETRGNM
jgi:MFS family permease